MSATTEDYHREGDTYEHDREKASSESQLGRIHTHSTVPEDTSHINSVPDFFDPNLDFSHASLEVDSPYPEVRAAVANFDDPSMPASTLRAWVIGLFWAVLLPGVNQFFSFRYPSILVSGFVAQLVAFPMGRVWARIMPRIKILGVSVNPGPFSIKEHVLVTVMAGVGAQSAYATDVISVQRVYYNQSFDFIYDWMLVMSTQFIGFSVGGIARRFLVAPPSMIWPGTLVSCALFNTLHSQTYFGSGLHNGMSRERFFLFAFLAAMIWYIVPGYLFQALSVFSWVCWIVPDNKIVNQLFGYRSGMGFSLLTFDWNQIAFIGSPLATPWWAEANIFASFVFFYWILTPLLYYTNVWCGSYLPISSRNAFDNTGEPYNISRVLNTDSTLNTTAYTLYSPLFLSTTFAVSYGLAFASVTATVVHSLIYFSKPIKLHFGRSLREQPDIHAQLMSRYRQVPEWWYACIFVVAFVFAGLCIGLWPTGMTIWALIIALLIAFVYVVPIGMIQAITNRQVGLNVLGEIIAGLILPGRPVAMMMFKTWTYITMSQAMIFTSDFKLGHYMKVPPRPMFWAQVVSTAIAGLVQLGVQEWMFSNIEGICTPGQKDHFSCANIEVFGTASIVWGVVGPIRQFGKGQIYYALVFFFVIGAVCPILLWCLTRRYPHSWLNYINFPLIFAGLGLLPPANASNFVPWAILGFIFQFVIRRRFFPFWAKYNYVLSAALDAGTAVGVILVYFCLQYPDNGSIGADSIQTWWGNTVFRETADWKNLPFKTVEDGRTFGPLTWS